MTKNASMTADAPRDPAPAADAAVPRAASRSARHASDDDAHDEQSRRDLAGAPERDDDERRRSRGGDDAPPEEGAAASLGRAVSDTVLDSGRSDREPPETGR